MAVMRIKETYRGTFYAIEMWIRVLLETEDPMAYFTGDDWDVFQQLNRN
jgi:hypothetical protein